MKYFLIGIAIFISVDSYACNRSVDSSRVILFVDANDSPREIASARTAACNRGENLVVVEPNEFNSRVEQLANSGTTITSLIASGHDGGGSFGGENGRTSKWAMIEQLNEAYRNAGQSELLEDLHGVYLWGCYTTVPGEVNYWSSELPNVKFIIGFQGLGPSNTNVTGIRMLGSALESQGRVERAQTTRELQAALNGIQGINTTFSGTFVNACEHLEDQFYYTNIGNERGGLDRNFASFSETRACYDRIREFSSGNPSMESILEDYRRGEVAIPQTTHGTNLREIYTYLRQNDHCFSGEVGERSYPRYNANKAGLLLFFHGVKRNFAVAFEDQITRAGTELAAIQSQLSTPSSSLYQIVPERYRDEFANAWVPTLENISNKSRSDILENMRTLSLLKFLGDDLPTENLNEMTSNMEQYINYMTDECMNFLDWHEYIPGRVPTSRCPEVEYDQESGFGFSPP